MNKKNQNNTGGFASFNTNKTREDQEIRTHCLELATRNYPGGSGLGEDIVKTAKKYYNFIMNQEDE